MSNAIRHRILLSPPIASVSFFSSLGCFVSLWFNRSWVSTQIRHTVPAEAHEQKQTKDLLRFLSPFEDSIQQIALWLREFVWNLYPDSNELIYDNYNALAVGWSPTDRLGHTFCSIAVGRSSGNIHFGFYWGSQIADPKKILLGQGNQYRYILVKSKEDFPKAYIKKLVKEAYGNSQSGQKAIDERKNNCEIHLTRQKKIGKCCEKEKEVSLMRTDDLYSLPENLPVPLDDGACDHLRGASLPSIELQATSGVMVDLSKEESGWLIIYCYPRTGRPNEEPIGGVAAWDAIPGSRGCTPQSCAYRDHHAELTALDATVYGISTQDTDYQREAASRLHLPFSLLSDAQFKFSRALRLPTFTFMGMELIRRLTLIVRAGKIQEVFYPVFPPDADSERVIAWLSSHGSK